MEKEKGFYLYAEIVHKKNDSNIVIKYEQAAEITLNSNTKMQDLVNFHRDIEEIMKFTKKIYKKFGKDAFCRFDLGGYITNEQDDVVENFAYENDTDLNLGNISKEGIYLIKEDSQDDMFISFKNPFEDLGNYINF